MLLNSEYINNVTVYFLGNIVGKADKCRIMKLTIGDMDNFIYGVEMPVLKQKV